jgi:hypothetical protein
MRAGQRWIEKKIPRTRHQNDLVLAAELSLQRFRGDDSTKAAAGY